MSAPVSIWHWNVAPASEVNVKVGVLSLVGDVIGVSVVSGAAVSTITLCADGGARPVRVLGVQVVVVPALGDVRDLDAPRAAVDAVAADLDAGLGDDDLRAVLAGAAQDHGRRALEMRVVRRDGEHRRGRRARRGADREVAARALDRLAVDQRRHDERVRTGGELPDREGRRARRGGPGIDRALERGRRRRVEGERRRIRGRARGGCGRCNGARRRRRRSSGPAGAWCRAGRCSGSRCRAR